jgi:hypothetical protein
MTSMACIEGAPACAPVPHRMALSLHPERIRHTRRPSSVVGRPSSVVGRPSSVVRRPTTVYPNFPLDTQRIIKISFMPIVLPIVVGSTLHRCCIVVAKGGTAWLFRRHVAALCG